MQSTKWDYPQQVSDVELAFGGGIERLLPTEKEIPAEFWSSESKWNKAATALFFGTISDTSEIIERPGIDVHFAARHIRTIFKSFQPKHEHKIAGCAYLLSRFYLDIT